MLVFGAYRVSLTRLGERRNRPSGEPAGLTQEGRFYLWLAGDHGSVGSTVCGMAVGTKGNQREPLTFGNAPTVNRDGVIYVDDDAAVELARRIARRDAELLRRLAAE